MAALLKGREMAGEDGFYWVKRGDCIKVACWHVDAWSLVATDREFGDSDFEWIGEQLPDPVL